MTLTDLGGGEPPVTLSEVKSWCRIERDDEDATLTLLMRAASESVEAALDLALFRRSFRLVLNHTPDCGRIALAKGPVVSVTRVSAYDTAGAETVFDAQTTIRIEPGGMALQFDPTVLAAGGITMEFEAGPAPSEVSAEIKRAILAVIATFYEARSLLRSERGRTYQGTASSMAGLLQGQRRVRLL
ncbi:MAG: phage head-tail connector protein [Fulvimarina manganoxydans]|uniref:head-tail connector protein n=1 Tax=Fulvimarina manganoxydans TaxID=937218 RepID=UPI00235691DD|nr:head-tail connector protein [Fulvimarina manganoxydans]MCK5933441.1 phage head-tail connector protein [Fulvimarina manganoxydans]